MTTFDGSPTHSPSASRGAQGAPSPVRAAVGVAAPSVASAGHPFIAAHVAAAVSVAWLAAAVAAAFVGLSWQWPACGLVLALGYGAIAHMVAETVRLGRRSARLRRAYFPRNVRVLPPEGRLLAAMAATPQAGPVTYWPDDYCPDCGSHVVGTPCYARDDWSRKAPPPLAAVPDTEQSA